MIIYNLFDDGLHKDSIELDEERLFALKSKINNQLVKKRHKIVCSDYDPTAYKNGNIHYVNVKCTPTGDTKEYDTAVRSIYRYEYDEYEDHYLVKLIDKLTDEKSFISAYNEFLNISKNYLSVLEEQKELVSSNLKAQFIDINSDMNKFDEKYKEFKEMQQEVKKIDKSIEQAPVIMDFATSILSCINIRNIDILSLEDFSRVYNFFDNSFKDVDNLEVVKSIGVKKN